MKSGKSKQKEQKKEKNGKYKMFPGRYKNCYKHLGKVFGLCTKAVHMCFLWFTHSTIQYIPGKNAIICVCQNVYMCREIHDR
jgi:hypothetical protein